MVVTINVNCCEVKDTVSPLIKARNKTVMGFMDKSAETIPVVSVKGFC